MGTIERTLTLDKKLVRMVVEPDGRVYVYGQAVDVASGQSVVSVQGEISGRLTTTQQRTVADLIATGEAWADAQTYEAASIPVVVPPMPPAPLVSEPTVT